MPTTIEVPRVGAGPPAPIGLYDFLQTWPEGESGLAIQNLGIYCMRERGWPIDPLDIGDVPPEVRLRDDILRGDAAVIARWGYGAATAAANPDNLAAAYPASSGERKSFADALAEDDYDRYNADYSGRDETALGGCAGWAQTGVAGPQSLNPGFYDDIGATWMQLRESSDYKTLVQVWGACMTDAGVSSDLAVEPAATFEYFENAAEQTTSDDELSDLAESERRVAGADLACRGSVDYSARIREISNPYVEEILQRYPNALSQPLCAGLEADEPCVVCPADATPATAGGVVDCVSPETRYPFPVLAEPSAPGDATTGGTT